MSENDQREEHTSSHADKQRAVDREGIRGADVLLVPNLLSLSRLILAVPALWALLHGKDLTAVIFLGLSFLTDVLDGFFARALHQKSELGKILDPVIDKLVVLGIAAVLTFAPRPHQLPLIVFLMILLRDVVILILASRALREDHYLFVSRWSGKATTFVIAITLLAFIVQDLVPDTVLGVLPWVAFALLGISSVDSLETYWSVKHKLAHKKKMRAEK